MTAIPPTVIIVHQKENRLKCSVEPLRDQPGFAFANFPFAERPFVDGYIRLGVDGPPLSTSDCGMGLLILDATWRHAAKMERHFEEVPVRSLTGWQTAYPRISKLTPDPAEGLATIEAIYAAFVILGRPTQGLLDQYRWRNEFLARNERLLSALATAG